MPASGEVLRPQQPIECSHADGQSLRPLVATDMDSTADLQDTADLPDDPKSGGAAAASDSAVRPDLAEISFVSDHRPSNAASTTDLTAIDGSPFVLVPKQRALGFFAFAGCALIAVYSIHWSSESSHPKTDVVLAAIAPTIEVERSPTGVVSANSPARNGAAEPGLAQVAKSSREGVGTGAAGVVTFESRSFVTSEKAVAAVFIVTRKQAVRGRAHVRWAAHSGSADAGIDFSDASGTARFADGQRQLAIYVPLRNDLLKEPDETFKVCLRWSREARIGGDSCAEATIRDDDIFPI